MTGSRHSARALRGAALALAAGALVTGVAGAGHAAPGDTYEITGDLDRTLYPGGSGSLDLLLTNISGDDLTVGELTVRVTGTTPQPGRLCLADDFEVTQLTGVAELALPAGTARTLTQLGVPASQLPQVRMLNTPVNQDGCKRARINLRYTGRATGEVGGVVAPTPTPDPTPQPSPEPTPEPEIRGGGLPGTGASSDSLAVALGGLGLIAIGAGAFVVTRRTKGAHQ